ncbi:MAG TPA: carbohydrate ABC transporter substrate-binding protein, partial [Candidatus Hydrogenedentes bacterium]|nr:carbohydrate ABC transporter substrate-binding protein [Candidatus Hydrogenedentota bacterium]
MTLSVPRARRPICSDDDTGPVTVPALFCYHRAPWRNRGRPKHTYQHADPQPCPGRPFMHKVLTYIRHLFLAAVLAGGTWLLWPPAEEEPEQGDAPGAAHRSENVDYVIKFSPGFQYMPGNVPYGIGDPLKGLADVIDDFEAFYEKEEGLNVRIQVVTIPGVREYLVAQLGSGLAPDIINVNVEDVWVDTQKGWYVPLDAFLEAPNTWVRRQGNPNQPGYEQWWDMFKYQAISRGKAAPDNRNYAVSFDMIETGIYYNKTIFREVGVEPPETWEDWMLVMNKLQEAGYIPLLMVLWSFNDWAVDLFFDQLYYGILPGIDLLQDPVREQYLEGYLDADEITFLNQKGFFTKKDPRYLEIWRLMREMRQYVNRNLTSQDPVREFVTQRGAQFWNHSGLVYRFDADPELDFEWGVFYLPPFTKQTTPYASETEMCVIGGSGTQLEVTNSAIRDTDPALPMEERIEQSRRLRVVIDFFQFIMLPENYVRIVNEYPGLMPNVCGVDPLPVLEPFERILDRRYTTTKWLFTFDLKFSEIQQRMLELYLNNGVELDEFMDWQTNNIAAAAQNHIRRKGVAMEEMEAAWQRLAPVRTHYEG